jgi:tRNA wybutosine-synthesizing protein 2
VKTPVSANGGGPVIAVPRQAAQDLIRELVALRLLDEDRKITKRGGEVLVPVAAEGPISLARFGARLESDAILSTRTVERNPRERIANRLRAAGIPPEIAPRRWRRVGDVIVLRIDPRASHHAKAIGEIYGTNLGAKTVVEDRSGIHGPMRVPDVRVLWGKETHTVHVEGGVRYALDVARVMLSPGNIEERMGIADRVPPGAVVADLFAGIGYFTLPIAVRSRSTVIYSCELNPTSYGFLVRNVRLNRVANVVPLLGDCRDVFPHVVADWVIMGHFDAREYLDVAFAALRGRGTIVYHELCPREHFPDALTRRLAAAARAHWRKVDTIRSWIVKSYAPGIVHAVAELSVSPQHRT